MTASLTDMHLTGRSARNFKLCLAARKGIIMDSALSDDLDGQIWYNGADSLWKANLHVLTHGLYYASCVFEGERAYNKKIFKLREHTDRLVGSANTLGFNIPYNADDIDDASESFEINGIVDGYIRPLRGVAVK